MKSQYKVVLAAAEITLLLFFISVAIHSSTAPEPAYEEVGKSSDIKLEKNPAYSASAVQDSSVDHYYDVIPTIV